MPRTLNYAAFLLLAAPLVACGPSKPENQTAIDLKLNGPVRSNYHHLAENPFGEGLLHAGFIVGIEKTERELLGVPKREDGFCERFFDYPHGDNEDACPDLLEAADDEVVKRTQVLGGHLNDVTDDGSPMFVSHILEYRPDLGAGGFPQPRMETRIVYNIHPSFRGGQEVLESRVAAKVAREKADADIELKGFYHEGWRGLEKRLKPSVMTGLRQARENETPYTHLIIGAMGWDNDQVESVRRYNALLGNTIAEARKPGDAAGRAFNPLFIGVTWPSVWGVDGFFDVAKLAAKLLGYGVKADDADEVGYTYVNWLINDLALDAKARNPELKVVVLGHSFGSRITSRATFSGHLLKRNPTAQDPQHVDLLVGLQAAFSANRFIGSDQFDEEPSELPDPNCVACGPGLEGAPYADLEDFDGSVVMTWSEHDGANPLAYIISRAAHMGGDLGYEEAKKDRAKPFFQLVDGVGEDGVLPPDACSDADRQKVQMVDASNFILDHNDMLDSATGRFLWSAIKCHAPNPASS